MYKSKLQELCHKRNWELPVYATVKDGPDHCPRFTSTVTVQGQTFQSPPNACKSSKEAQNLAAKVAFDHFDSAESQAISVAISPPSPTALPSPGFLYHSGKNSRLKQNQEENALADQSRFNFKYDIASKGFLDLSGKNNRLKQNQEENALADQSRFNFKDDIAPKGFLDLSGKNRRLKQNQEENALADQSRFNFKDDIASKGFLDLSGKNRRLKQNQEENALADQSRFNFKDDIASKGFLDLSGKNRRLKQNQEENALADQSRFNFKDDIASKGFLDLSGKNSRLKQNQEENALADLSRFNFKDDTSKGFLDLSGKNNRLKQNQEENALADQSLFNSKDYIAPKDLHVYKNRLQHYAQKKNLNLPEYSCEIDGPPHARRFRASVKIGGRTFKSPAYFAILKDSEHAAAREAFLSLSVGEVQEDEGLYKTLLQELAQKKGFLFPSYTTITIGRGPNATFVSTVEVGGQSFEGRECKTKKLSEMNAAKNAYNSLVECSDNKKGNTEVKAGGPQLITSHGNKGASGATVTHAELAAMGIGEMYSSHSGLSLGDLKNDAANACSSSLDSVITHDLQADIQPMSSPSANEDAKAKECSKHGLEESDAEKPASACGSKIVVHPCKAAMKIPPNATRLPYCDDKWVALKLDAYQPR